MKGVGRIYQQTFIEPTADRLDEASAGERHPKMVQQMLEWLAGDGEPPAFEHR
jgi:hypothetical protein